MLKIYTSRLILLFITSKETSKQRIDYSIKCELTSINARFHRVEIYYFVSQFSSSYGTTVTLITNKKKTNIPSPFFSFSFKLTLSTVLNERSSTAARATRSGIRVVRKLARYGRYSQGKARILCLVSSRHLFHPSGRSQRQAMRWPPRFSIRPNTPSIVLSALTGRGKRRRLEILKTP